MNDRSIRPFLVGFLLSAAGVALFLYWQRQMRRMQAPGVVLLGRPDPDEPAQRNVDVAGDVTSTVAESLTAAVKGMKPRAAGREAADDLTEISGIGPVYARRLREAGIHTFAALAATDPDELAYIVKLQAWQAAYPGEWVLQAAALVGRA